MVTARGTLTFIPYERRYRAQALDLLEYSYQRHLHLDWYESDQWLDSDDGLTQLAFRGTQLVGLMSAALPVNGASWVRMVVVADGRHDDDLLEKLWWATARALREQGGHSAWVLMVEPWLEHYMPLLGMSEVERLITLRRDSSEPPSVPHASIRIEPAGLEDVPEMAAVDQAAFSTPYPMTLKELRRAYRFAELSRVARLPDGRIAGYQISTRHAEQGHLARLAVDPALQQRGIGATLVSDMLATFIRRGVRLVTLNTQGSNTRSMRLYTACGFLRGGYDIPIYRAML